MTFPFSQAKKNINFKDIVYCVKNVPKLSETNSPSGEFNLSPRPFREPAILNAFLFIITADAKQEKNHTVFYRKFKFFSMLLTTGK
jgi:hypothetical protein